MPKLEQGPHGLGSWPPAAASKTVARTRCYRAAAPLNAFSDRHAVGFAKPRC